MPPATPARSAPCGKLRPMNRQSQSANVPHKHLRVLLAETPPGEIAEALRNLFCSDSACLDLTTVSNAALLIPTVCRVRPEIIFLDLALDSAAPLHLVRSLHREAPDIPLIALVDFADRDNARQTLREGAADYLLKGHTESQIVERVLRAAVERNTMKGLSDLLRDPTTGFYNREGFCALAAKAVRSAEKSGGRLILLTAEIGNLEDLRREFGPSSPDQAVRDLATLIRGSFRRTDVVARWNDTKFVILALDALEPTAALMRQRIERHLAALNTSRGPWGEIKLALTTAFWDATSEKPFPELAFLIGADASGAQNAPETPAQEYSQVKTR